MSKEKQDKPQKYEKAGYRPLNEGYSPTDKRGYVPNAVNSELPKAPVGGTGQTNSPSGDKNKK